jgi:membrane protein implicated in regulation of membrane protease activity|tara:strand:- start:4243 stop:4701 length:459 start_codon:yes stop_codon:yes gene_type:complete
VEPEVWRWIWLVASATFVVGEIAMAGTFFLLPFGVGAAIATVVAFAGATASWQWLTFVIVSAAAFAAVRPLARRLDRGGNPIGVGSSRLIGETGVVIADLSPDPEQMGIVRIGREEWHAETADDGHLPSGTRIEVVQIEGTRAVVKAVSEPD